MWRGLTPPWWIRQPHRGKKALKGGVSEGPGHTIARCIACQATGLRGTGALKTGGAGRRTAPVQAPPDGSGG